jgi:hypothetical protein
MTLQGDLLETCLAALERQVACSSVSSLWAALLKGLRKELQSDLGAVPPPCQALVPSRAVSPPGQCRHADWTKILWRTLIEFNRTELEVK